jgi:opacity protein-like surface antigen
MIKRFVGFVVILFIASCVFVTVNAFAQRPQEGLGQWFQEFGAYTGYIHGELKEQKDLAAIALGLRFGFDLKPFTKKFGFEPKGLLELVYEPFINPITGPHGNVEMGVGMLLKYAYPLTKKLYPFIQAGVGPYYMTLHTYEQSTQFNFIDQGGAGFYYFFKDNVALNVEYRYRHVSNAGIDHPNGGFEASDYLAGMSWYY